MDHDDPTIPDRLILRSLIEEGLPARAAANDWPLRQPFEIARIIFDPLFRAPFEMLVPEPVFVNLPTTKLRPAITIALELMEADVFRVRALLRESEAVRE